VARLAAEIEKAKRLALGDFVMSTKGKACAGLYPDTTVSGLRFNAIVVWQGGIRSRC